MLQLITENKELKKKKEEWNEADHAYQKTIIEYKHKVEVLGKEKQLWFQEQKTKNQTMEKMTIQILQMKNMVAKEELHRQNIKKVKEQVVIEVNKLKQEMLKTKSKLDDLVEKNKDLDLAYVNNRLEKYDELVQYYSILHTKQHMDDTNVELNEWWELEKA